MCYSLFTNPATSTSTSTSTTPTSSSSSSNIIIIIIIGVVCCVCGWVVDVGGWLCWRRRMRTMLIVMFVVGLVGCYVWFGANCEYEG